jgi:hypothetical protein
MPNDNPKLEFFPEKKTKVEAFFLKGHITSDGGLLLIREIDKKFKATKQFSKCFTDYRNPKTCKYTLHQILIQRIYALCSGYEDLNDHDKLKKDPFFAFLSDKEGEIAGKSTLNRLELSSRNLDEAEEDRYKRIAVDDAKVEKLLVNLYLQSYSKPPKSIIIDFDSTDVEIHGNQEGKFYHGYYKKNCFLPLYAFIDGFLVFSKLRKSDIDGALGTKEALKMIVSEIRKKWPNTRIEFRADSGFAREEIIYWCEENKVNYMIALARNPRLLKMVSKYNEELESLCKKMKKNHTGYTSFKYSTLKTWSKKRKVIAKIDGKYFKETIYDYDCNARFIVTNLQGNAKRLYEKNYCKRGDVENRIKEQKFHVYATRTSSSKMTANQLRIWFSSISYILLHLLRVKALKNTSMKNSQCNSIRLHLIKIGAIIKKSVRRFLVEYSQHYVFKDIYIRAFFNIKKLKPLLC